MTTTEIACGGGEAGTVVDADFTHTIAPELRTPCRDRVMCIDGQVRPCLLANLDQGAGNTYYGIS